MTRFLERLLVLENPKNRVRVPSSHCVLDHLYLLAVLVAVCPVVISHVCVPGAYGFLATVPGYVSKLQTIPTLARLRVEFCTLGPLVGLSLVELVVRIVVVAFVVWVLLCLIPLVVVLVTSVVVVVLSVVLSGPIALCVAFVLLTHRERGCWSGRVQCDVGYALYP